MLENIKIKKVTLSVGITESQEKRLKKIVDKFNSMYEGNFLTSEQELSTIMQIGSNEHIERVLQKLEKELKICEEDCHE